MFQRVGTNFKLSDVLSAIGLAQMERIDELLTRRIELSRRYAAKLDGVVGVTLPRTTEGGEHSYQSFCVFIEERDRVLARLRGMGIEVQFGTFALHREPAFQPADNLRVVGPLTGSLHAFRHCLALPLYHTMTDDEQDAVVAELKAAL